jgi:prepilin-type N-terminal cleavage/methylation domain-containing protein
MRPPQRQPLAFTLLELLVVIAIIGILLGLIVPSLFGIYERARKTQAKNDLTQIVNAVNAFYTDYGKYPTNATTNIIYGPEGTATNDVLFNELQACHLVGVVMTPSCCSAADTLNTRQIVYLSPRCGAAAPARSGIASNGQYYDPWATPYNIEIDADYNNQIGNPYPDVAAGAQSLSLGVIGWSWGKDKTKGIKGGSPNYGVSDDVISWQ